MNLATGITVVVLSYLFGGLCAAYYVVRLRGGDDVRKQGSGTAGATNAGRSLGPAGFATVFALDFVKGILPVVAARLLGLDAVWIAAVTLAVVLGHVFPVQLGFQGGKGISTAFGALITVQPMAVLALLAAFVPAFILIRRFTLGGLLAWTSAPLLLWWWTEPGVPLYGFVALVAVLLLSHRADIQAAFTRGDAVAPEAATAEHAASEAVAAEPGPAAEIVT